MVIYIYNTILYYRKMSLNSPGDEKNNHSYKTSINAITMEQKGGYLNSDTNFEKFDIVYEINGEIFREKIFEDVNEFCEFNVNIDDATSLEEHETGEFKMKMLVDKSYIRRVLAALK